MEIDGDQSVESWEPDLVASHVAYFFIPLPDALTLPSPYMFRAIEQVPHDRMQKDGLPPMCVGASLCFHQIEVPAPGREEMLALFELAAQSLPDSSRPSNPTGSPGKLDAPSITMTVVEMAVAVDLPEGVDDAPEESGATEDGVIDDPISDAFDRGLEYVREFQRAHYIAKHIPVRLVTRESLPFAIPFAVRELRDKDGQPLPFEAPMSMYLLNANIPGVSVEWSEGDAHLLNTAIAHQAAGSAFSSYADLVREANVAFSRDGSYRSTVLFSATACEVLFDELLSHLMWEEVHRPESAAEIFDSLESISKRVKTQYHERLGGVWSLDAEGPVNRWWTDVATLRNRVVHGGYGPTLNEARAAIDATQSLVEFMGDRVASKLKKYPRTAMILSGQIGLERRGKWSRRMRDLVESKTEVPWRETFARWRSAMQRARVDGRLGGAPSAVDSPVLLVVRTSGSDQWVVHDARSGAAAVVDSTSVLGIEPAQLNRIAKIRESYSKDGERRNVSAFIYGARVTSVPTDAWIPDYRLVPEASVMVDGNDLDPV
ncbi:hypothetical protein [Promicromonospora sp. NPDC050249]|uniref:hypothetical protein n=1 Tax=Promicromonospora sp. NPDC050249 TaxID=3154743 RepID=UPI0033EF17BB